MVKIQVIHDLKEANGKTIKENNLDIQHEIPIGALVEINFGEWNGSRMFVMEHTRDCDGSPLYRLAPKFDLETFHARLEINGLGNRWRYDGTFDGFGPESLIVIKPPENKDGTD